MPVLSQVRAPVSARGSVLVLVLVPARVRGWVLVLVLSPVRGWVLVPERWVLVLVPERWVGTAPAPRCCCCRPARQGADSRSDSPA